MTDIATDIAQRRDWARRHGIILSALFDAPVLKEVPQRLWRLYVWADEEYVVATLIQNINVPSAPNQQTAKIQADVVRSYHHVSQGSLFTTVHLNLYGMYDVQQVVAFLELDRIDPDSVEWVDKTRYSDIVVVGGAIRPMRQD